MALNTIEVFVFIVFIVIGSIFTAWAYRRIVQGITTRTEERSATRFGRSGKASEKIVIKEE